MAYTLIVEAQQIYFYRCRAAFQTHNSIINLCYVPGFAAPPCPSPLLLVPFDTFAVIRWTMRALKKATQWEIQLPMGLNADQSSGVSGRIHQWARHEKASNRCQCCHAANTAYAQLFRKPYKSRHNACTDYIVYIHTHTRTYRANDNINSFEKCQGKPPWTFPCQRQPARGRLGG